MNIRKGELSDQDFDLLDSRVFSNLKPGSINIDDCTQCTHIYSTRAKVETHCLTKIL